MQKQRGEKKSGDGVGSWGIGRREAVRALSLQRVKCVVTGAPGRISTDGSVKWQAARVTITELAAI
jgi:hypothetical protein